MSFNNMWFLDSAPSEWKDIWNNLMKEATDFVAIMQKRQGYYVSSIEEIAYRRGYINKQQLYRLAEPLRKTEYGQYLLRVPEEK